MNPSTLELLRRVAAYLHTSLSYVYDSETADLYADVCAAIEGANHDPRIDGYNAEFLGAKPPKAGEDY